MTFDYLNVWIPYYQKYRRVRIYLPMDYHRTNKCYPVLYLHDGQNVFIDEESFSGHSWRVIDTLREHSKIPSIIVVAIDNAEERRLNEYGPWQTDGKVVMKYTQKGGEGDLYATWFVEILKPMIDKQYRTLVDKKNTLIAGSSMGGLISAYIGAKYSDVFGNLGIFSLASWFSEREFIDFISTHPLAANTKVYIQVGTKEGHETAAMISEKEMSQIYLNCSIHYAEQLIAQGMMIEQIWLRILAGETHTEKFWANHFAEFLLFVFEDKRA